jgi:hypothetical protein
MGLSNAGPVGDQTRLLGKKSATRVGRASRARLSAAPEPRSGPVTRLVPHPACPFLGHQLGRHTHPGMIIYPGQRLDRRPRTCPARHAGSAGHPRSRQPPRHVRPSLITASTARYRCSATLISLVGECQGSAEITVNHQAEQYKTWVGRVGLEPTARGL